jgi:hypothetical protein
MRKIFINLISSFDAHTLGFSARKLSAFAGVVMAIVVTLKLPKDAYLHAIYAWQTFALLCLGIVTIEQIIRLKNGGDKENIAP